MGASQAGPAKFEKQATRIAIGLVIAGFALPLVAGVLGSAEVFPYEHTMTVALVALIVPIGSALLIGAMGGLYIMGGWKLTPFGIVDCTMLGIRRRRFCSCSECLSGP